MMSFLRRFALGRDVSGERIRRLGWGRWFKLERTELAQLLRSAVAASVSFAMTGWLVHNDAPVNAAVAALLVTQATGYKTAWRGVQRAAGVFLGFLASLLIGDVIGLTWWIVGLTVILGTLVGQLLRLDTQAQQIATTVLFVIGQTAPAAFGRARLIDNLVGALIGLIIGMVVPAGSFTRRAAARIALQAGDAAELLGWMGSGSAGGLLPTDTLHWLSAGRRLSDQAASSSRTVGDAREALRWTVHRPARREQIVALSEAGTCLVHVCLLVRGLARGLSNLTFREGHPPAVHDHRTAVPEVPVGPVSLVVEPRPDPLMDEPPVVMARVETDLPEELPAYLKDLSRAVYRLSRLYERGGPNPAAQVTSLRESLRFAEDREMDLIAEVRRMLNRADGQGARLNWRAITIASIVEDGRRIRNELDPDQGPHVLAFDVVRTVTLRDRLARLRRRRGAESAKVAGG